MLRREHADTARTAKLLFKASPVTLKYLLLLCFAVLFCMVCLQSRTKTVEFVFESKEKLLDLVGNEEKLEKALLSRVKRTPPEIPRTSLTDGDLADILEDDNDNVPFSWMIRNLRIAECK